MIINIGIILLIIGIGIRYFTILQLKRDTNWRIIKPSIVRKNGIYSIIRHPMYFGGLIDYSGLCLILTNNLGFTISLFVILLNFILDRIDREEQFLIMCFGNEYIEYMNKTKMLIPFIW